MSRHLEARLHWNRSGSRVFTTGTCFAGALVIFVLIHSSVTLLARVAVGSRRVVPSARALLAGVGRVGILILVLAWRAGATGISGGRSVPGRRRRRKKDDKPGKEEKDQTKNKNTVSRAPKKRTGLFITTKDKNILQLQTTRLAGRRNSVDHLLVLSFHARVARYLLRDIARTNDAVLALHVGNIVLVLVRSMYARVTLDSLPFTKVGFSRRASLARRSVHRVAILIRPFRAAGTSRLRVHKLLSFGALVATVRL